MRTAIMQPYLLPYIGYYQLVKAVDVFVFYDDVHFITKGYVNRNAIWANGNKLTFTVPLSKASQNVLIKDVAIHTDQYVKWWSKFKKTVNQNYGSAPYFNQTMPLLEEIFHKPGDSIADLAEKSIRSVANYLGLFPEFKKSSELSYNRKAGAEEKILELCHFLDADTYINPIGGADLYTSASFKKHGVELLFLKSRNSAYPQKSDTFVPSLSMIDVLMYNDKNQILKLMGEYDLSKTA